MTATAANIIAVPDHVPPELVVDFDFMAHVGNRDVFAWWSEVHARPDIFFSPRHGGYWVLTRHDDIAHVLETYATFSSEHQTVPKAGKLLPLPPITLDPPLHSDFRRLLAPFFTPKSIGDLELKARAITLEVLDRIADKGECDFVADFALVMPIGIFMGLVDLPEADRLELLAIAEDMVHGTTPEAQERGFVAAFTYLGKVVAERRLKPGRDAISAMLAGRVEGGRPLTDNELLGMGALLLAGGLDTVASTMGFIMLFLARNPGHRRRLVDNPALIPVAVEELIRRHSIANIARTVVHDTVYKGVMMKAGDMVLTPTSAAGIDDRRYPDPLTVDFDRDDKKSIAFGKGPHQCIGAFLARTEIRVFLTEWLKRIPDFAVKPGVEPLAIAGRTNALLSLPLVWPA